MKRAAARATWPGRVVSLQELQAEEDLSANTSVDERLGMMRELAEAAWALSGKPLPSYPRSQMPGRIIRGVRR